MSDKTKAKKATKKATKKAPAKKKPAKKVIKKPAKKVAKKVTKKTAAKKRPAKKVAVPAPAPLEVVQVAPAPVAAEVSPSNPPKRLGELFKAARLASDGKSIRAAAAELGMSVGHLSDIEGGKHANVTAKVLVKLHKVFGVPVNDIWHAIAA